MPPQAVLPEDLLLVEQDFPVPNETRAQWRTRTARAFRKMHRQTAYLQSEAGQGGLHPSSNKKFKVRNAEEDEWEGCNLQCSKCTACKKRGTGPQCTNTVCIGQPCCWQHSLQLFKVRTARTMLQAHGRLTFNGLFACDTTNGPNAIVFRGPTEVGGDDGAMILPYIAERVSAAIIDERYGEDDDTVAPYGLHIATQQRHVGRYEDAACHRTMMSLANTIVNEPGYAHNHMNNPAPNAQFNVITVNGNNTATRGYISVLQAIRDIRNGDEILVLPDDYPLPDDPDKYYNRGIKPSQTGCRMRAA
jgi:hypothetical protein